MGTRIRAKHAKKKRNMEAAVRSKTTPQRVKSSVRTSKNVIRKTSYRWA